MIGSGSTHSIRHRPYCAPPIYLLPPPCNAFATTYLHSPSLASPKIIPRTLILRHRIQWLGLTVDVHRATLGEYSHVREALIEIRSLEVEVPRPEPLLANSVAKAAEAVRLVSKLKDLQPPAP